MNNKTSNEKKYGEVEWLRFTHCYFNTRAASLEK